ncbi:hypothetical protein [Nesterenkonia muleiensis]|uniref:hypothetical protein n=1 Tax=Nesterenkonia muleiensis TaxID=2282648 RepID=UPI001300BEC3|nr:hypothetical protein [Nesterenkonia muleiensis]
MQRRIFLSYGKNDDGTAPLGAGAVYALARDHFLRMPSHTDPVLGPIAECQWVSTETVPVVAEVLVTPKNLPMTPRFHDLATVSAREGKNPEGFPWVGDSGSLQ